MYPPYYDIHEDTRKPPPNFIKCSKLSGTIACMEGPSLFLAQEQLRPFKKKMIVAAEGNTKAIPPNTVVGMEVNDIFAWGKHLVFQFDTFAIRIHFMLFG